MLAIHIPEIEIYDEVNSEFVYIKEQTLQLEHSLVSISKWESIWHKPFLNKKDKSQEEIVDYIKCMTITQNVDPIVYNFLPLDVQNQIVEYIKDPMTATTVKSSGKKNTGKIATSELIYFWMISYGIPFECQKWHLNRLMKLIEVCEEENKPKKKMSMSSIMKRNSALNDLRRAKTGSTG